MFKKKKKAKKTLFPVEALSLSCEAFDSCRGSSPAVVTPGSLAQQRGVARVDSHSSSAVCIPAPHRYVPTNTTSVRDLSAPRQIPPAFSFSRLAGLGLGVLQKSIRLGRMCVNGVVN